MNALAKDGKYTIDADTKAKIDRVFSGYYTDEEKTAETIKTVFEKYGYLCDTHTAVAVNAAEEYSAQTNDGLITVVDSTASPYKFAADVYASLGQTAPADPLDALDALSAYSNTEIAYPLRGLGERKVRFTDVCDPADMADKVLEFIK